MESYRIEFAANVRKDFRKIPKREAERILESIQALSAGPRPPGSIKLKGEALYRLRVGIYRVVYEIEDNVLLIVIVRVQHRKDVYRD